MTGAVVVKIGSAPIDAMADAARFWDALARACNASPARIAVVHGGGRIVDARLAALGHSPVRVDGLRVTPQAQIEEVVASLAGVANTRVSGALQARGVRVAGLRVTDAGLTRAAAADPSKRLGCVAIAKPGDGRAVRLLFEAGVTPVISSIGVDDSGAPMNINADAAAAAVACALRACALILVTATPGILSGAGKTLPRLDEALLRAGVSTGAITAGMLPKAQAALSSAEQAGCAVRIVSWRSIAERDALDWRALPGTAIDPPGAGAPHHALAAPAAAPVETLP